MVQVDQDMVTLQLLKTLSGDLTQAPAQIQPLQPMILTGDSTGVTNVPHQVCLNKLFPICLSMTALYSKSV